MLKSFGVIRSKKGCERQGYDDMPLRRYKPTLGLHTIGVVKTQTYSHNGKIRIRRALTMVLKLMTKADLVQLQRTVSDRVEDLEPVATEIQSKPSDAHGRVADLLRRYPKIVARLAE